LASKKFTNKEKIHNNKKINIKLLKELATHPNCRENCRSFRMLSVTGTHKSFYFTICDKAVILQRIFSK
jgi:hypothetical protein